MGSATSTSSRVVLQAANTATQTSIAKCGFQCDQTESNNTVIISPGATVGNILFENICVIQDASCQINQNIDTSVINALNATVNQTALSTQPLFSLTFNSTKASSSLDEVATNQITQLINSTCTFSTNQQMNNNYVYVGNNATVGDISFVQHSTLSNVECTMDIAAKTTASNNETATVTQVAATIDTTTIIIIAIIIVVLAVAVFVFINFFRRKNVPKPPPPPPAAIAATPPQDTTIGSPVINTGPTPLKTETGPVAVTQIRGRR
jgi:hypothetical protein